MNQLNEQLGATAEQGQVGGVRGVRFERIIQLSYQYIKRAKDLSILYIPHQRETSKVEWYNTMLNRLG